MPWGYPFPSVSVQLLPVVIELKEFTAAPRPPSTSLTLLSRFSDIEGDNTDSIAESVEDEMILSCHDAPTTVHNSTTAGTTNSALSINLF